MPKAKKTSKSKKPKASKKKPAKLSPPSLANFFLSLKSHQIQLLTFIFAGIFFLLLPGQNQIQTMVISSSSTPLPEATQATYHRPIPVLPPEIAPPQLTAKSAIAIDLDSSVILYQKDPNTRMMPASTTKIMTALVALNDYRLDDVVTITNADESVGHRAEIISGEQLTVEDLLYALMLNSGNDAAVALAQHHPQGYFGFIKRMNQLARDLHLTNTHFINASGIEDDQHFTTARDLAILTKQALTYPVFAKIVSTQERNVTSVDGQYQHYLRNINQLLGKVPGLLGVKTGWTHNAGECLVTYTNRDHHRVVTVVLNSGDRFGESETLIEWLYQNYHWLTPQELIQAANPS